MTRDTPLSPVLYPLAGKRVWIAGHTGMVGAAIARRLEKEDCEILTVPRFALDLRRQADVERWITDTQPDAVILAAATVGGIYANDTRPAEFLYDNLAIETNVIEAARLSGVGKLMFLGSACIYPRDAPQPMKEEALLTGPLEPTNQWYAIAKIAGLKMCQAYRRQYGCDYISAMPNNLFGPGDNFDPEASHVVPALIRKIDAAKAAGDDTVTLWGTGTPLREFMFVDDMADAAAFLLMRYSGEEHVNIGSGEEISIGALAGTIAEVIGWSGEFILDTAKPDGAPRKLLDTRRLDAMGWRPATGLRDGLARTCEWYRDAR